MFKNKIFATSCQPDTKHIFYQTNHKHIYFLFTLVLYLAMAKWTSSDFIKELQDISKLNEVRNGDAVISKLVGQLKEKMNHAGSITATTLIALSEAIAATSFGDDLKRSLQDKVDDLTLNNSNNGTLKVVSKGQMLKNIYNYLSVQEVEQIRTAPLPTAVQICCKRLKKLG